VGDTVRVVNAQWTVTDAYLTNQLKSVFGKKNGRFVVVEFTFKNLGNEEVTLDETLHVKLEDSRGREYGPDADSWEFVPQRKNIFLQLVNPGVSQDGMAIFPVSPGASGFIFVGDDVAFLEDQAARFDLGNMQTQAIPSTASATATATATATAGQ
jgi:hypothetical protein